MKKIIYIALTVVLALIVGEGCTKSNTGSSGNNSTTGNSATVTTFAGNGTAGITDGTGSSVQFNNPAGTAVDPQGNVFVIDGNRIRKITPAGLVSTFAGSDTAGTVNATGTMARFNGPDGIGTDAEGNLYIGEYGSKLIRKITASGVVTTLAGSGKSGLTDGTAAQATFENPDAITVDSSGNVYVGDFGSRIRKITATGIVTTIAGTSDGYLDGPVASAQFYGIRGIAIDAQRNLYVVDCDNNRIRKISVSGVVSTLAGGNTASPFLDGMGANASFYLPASMSIDSKGNLYVADQSNNAIRKISADGAVTTIAGNGSAGFVNAQGSKATFNSPRSASIDASGNIYVGDLLNHCIRKIAAQ